MAGPLKKDFFNFFKGFIQIITICQEVVTLLLITLLPVFQGTLRSLGGYGEFNAQRENSVFIDRYINIYIYIYIYMYIIYSYIFTFGKE